MSFLEYTRSAPHEEGGLFTIYSGCPKRSRNNADAAVNRFDSCVYNIRAIHLRFGRLSERPLISRSNTARHSILAAIIHPAS